MYLAKGLFSS